MNSFRWLIVLFILLPSLCISQNRLAFLSPSELQLYNLINNYRVAHYLPVIPISQKLSLVAKTHCMDLYNNYVWDASSTCNMHSWSDKGSWTSVCYTEDHAQASKMWMKPKEIAGYNAYGYEIAHGHSPKDNECSPDCALNGWKHSPGHNRVIMNQGIWESHSWNAIGVGMYKGYACVWFGEISDL